MQFTIAIGEVTMCMASSASRSQPTRGTRRVKRQSGALPQMNGNLLAVFANDNVAATDLLMQHRDPAGSLPEAYLLQPRLHGVVP